MNSHQRRIQKRAEAVIKLNTELIPNPTLTSQAHPYERALHRTGDTAMNQKEKAALDRHITGNYGEDQFKGDSLLHEQLEQKSAGGQYCAYCSGKIRFWHTPIGIDSPPLGERNKVVVHYTCMIDFTREIYKWLA